MSQRRQLTIMEKAFILGLYHEVLAMRDAAPAVLRQDKLLGRIIAAVRQPELPDLIQDDEGSSPVKRIAAKLRSKKSPRQPATMVANPRLAYYGALPPHETYALQSKASGYLLFLWRRKQGGVLAVADSMSKDGGRAFIFEADSCDDLKRFFASRPRRSALPKGGNGVYYKGSVVHHHSGSWRESISKVVCPMVVH